MKRDVLPMPSFGGTGITGTLSMPERLEAASVAARETAEDRERLVLENARLRTLLTAATEDRAAWRPVVDAAVAWTGGSREDREELALALSRATDGYLRGLIEGQRKRNDAACGCNAAARGIHDPPCQKRSGN